MKTLSIFISFLLLLSISALALEKGYKDTRPNKDIWIKGDVIKVTKNNLPIKKIPVKILTTPQDLARWTYLRASQTCNEYKKWDNNSCDIVKKRDFKNRVYYTAMVE